MRSGWFPSRASVLKEAPVVAAGLAVGVLLVLLAPLGAAATGRTTFYFMHEAQEVLDGPWYAGSVSVLTALLWWTGAVAAGVAALVLSDGRRAFAFAAVLSAVIALDDVLRLHDDVYPAFGLGEKYLAVGYLVLYGLYGYVSRDLSARWGRLGLATVVMLLGASAGIDYALQPLVGREVTLLEDGAKTLGAGVWAAVQVRFAVAEIRDAAGRDARATEEASAPQHPPLAPRSRREPRPAG